MVKLLSKEDVKNILETRHVDNPYGKLQNLPHPHNFKDIKRAASRIKQAVQDKENIVVVGDYDVDGIVSTAIMVEFFEKVGVKIRHFIPNRFKHGYGLSKNVIEEILDSGVQNGIIITVDNGISSFEAAELCASMGIDLIITDHHTVGEQVPKAFAIINPKQDECTFPYKHICGAQVAWYVCAAIKNELKAEVDMSDFFDLLSIAIISDIMPMESLNYTLTKKGLSSICEFNRISLTCLTQRFGRQNLKSDDIGFLVSPLLNSAGRLDDPIIALNFLLSKTQEEANFYLEKLISLNEQRKKLQKQVLQEALTKIDETDSVICVWSSEWNEGVIGIIASNLSQKYKKPAFVFSLKNGIAKGSARSIGNINLYELLVCVSQLLIGFGGHKSAAGLSLKEENLELLKTSLSSCIHTLNFEKDSAEDTLFGEIKLSDVDLDLCSIVNKYEPYGLGNEKPIFLINNVKIHKISSFGRNMEFSKLVVVQDKSFKEVVIFEEVMYLNEGDKVCINATVSKNSYANEDKPQLLARQITLAG